MSKEQVTIYLTPELRQALNAAAFVGRKKFSSLVAEALEVYLSSYSSSKFGKSLPIPRVAEEQPAELPALSKVEKILAEHATALESLRGALASLEERIAPRPLDMPAGKFSRNETLILEMVCAGRARGATAAAIEERFNELNISFTSRRDALSNLRKMKILKRTRTS